MKSQQIASLAAIIGIALIGLSYAWPAFTSGREHWSDEQAQELLNVRAALHGHSHELNGHSHEHNGGESHASAKSVDQAELESRRRKLENELESAQSGGGAAARVLWIVGALLAAAGAGVYFVDRGN